MNLRPCTICSARDAGRPARVNPRLCAGCQDWDDLLHVNYCRERADGHAPLNPVLFCYKHNPNWPPARKGNYGEFKDLEFFSADHYYAARAEGGDGGGCIMCSAVGDALRRAAEDVIDGRGMRIAVWRPFILDPAKNQWNVRDEQTALEKGMVPWSQKCVLAVVIATAPPAGEEDGAWSYEPGIVEVVLRYEKWCYDLSRVSPWERTTMDISQIKSWLGRCADEHGAECNGSWIPPWTDLPRGFRLIDVRERRVVTPEPGVGYVTLSYVWNAASSSPEKQNLQLYKENLKELEQPGSLSDAILPEVVADAIYLCAELGKPYLWVDRFCIVQDDPDLKAEQINAMGVIYDRALLTFISLGDGPTPGLMGLPCRPRRQTFRNRSWDLLPTMSNPVGEVRLPLIDMAISESKWDSRAWTFQETALSKRHIYFDAGQVYGSCTKERWQERPSDVDEASWRENGPWEMHQLRKSPWDLSPDSFAAYSGVISQYSPRKLTFPKDVLRAFAGISNVLEMTFKRTLIQGHPEEFFTESLRWVPQPGFLTARRDLDTVPTWSWASWDSKATWDTDWTMAPGIYLANLSSGVRASFVNFHVSDPKEGLRPVKERHQSLELYLIEQKRAALKVIKEAAASWWPSSISDDPMTVDVKGLEEMTKYVLNCAHQKSQDNAHPWPPSTARTPRTERLHDLDEDATAFAALRNLEEHTDTRWWPPTTAKDPETSRQLDSLSIEASALAEGIPNSLVFNTSCAYLKVGPFGRMWFRIPPRRHLSGCAIQNRDGIPVGITMAMAPQLTFDMFGEGKEHLVALLGVCSSKRFMQWDKGERSRLPIHHLNELCLIVMIMEEKDGACRRLALGVVYPNEWIKAHPQWRSVVLA
ncbi:heterokaryon incompatibility protein-domain-containing protein [Nemania sp. NC0429]|nr:heterokaryon incompatibility protein-domain-containing protein [Nemania sp. NC0429]